MKQVSKKAKRRLKILTICIFSIVAFIFSSVYKDWKQIVENKRLAQSLNSAYSDLLNEEQNLNSEVTKFQDPEYIARYAREKYLYSLPGELLIKKPSE